MTELQTAVSCSHGTLCRAVSCSHGTPRRAFRRARQWTAGAAGGTRAGFVLLVEAVLALFVISMGVLAGVALITSSLDRGREARADTLLAMFGEGILDGLRAMSLDAASTNGWAGFWDAVSGGATGIPVPCQWAWEPDNAAVFSGGPVALALTNYNHHAGSAGGIPAVSLRYALSVSPRPSFGGRTNWCAQLKLWEGAFGTTNEARSRLFYTEIFEPGVLR